MARHFPSWIPTEHELPRCPVRTVGAPREAGLT